MSYLSCLQKAELLKGQAAFHAAMTSYHIPFQHKSAQQYYISTLLSKKKKLKNIEFNWTDDRAYFPFKPHTNARVKVNLFLRDVVAGSGRYRSQIEGILGANIGAFNDSAVCWVLWSVAMMERGVAADTCCYFFAQRENTAYLKQINTTVKALGVLNHPLASCFCELITLSGRGSVTKLDPWDDIKGRVKKKIFFGTKAASFNEGELRHAIRDILSEECGDVEYPDPDVHWTKRWAYTKSGAHARRIERMNFGEVITEGSRVNRRNFAETVDRNMIAFGPPRVVAGVSVKHEPGKDRWIYGADSISYYTFDYLLTPLERAWRGVRVLLKPAVGGMYPKYREWAASLGTHKIMLDYDDFNSQHTNTAMRLVYEEAFSGAPKHIREWAVESVDNEIVCFGQPEKRMKKVGTLFSGHRATTFINSVLNAAYMRLVLGNDYFLLRSIHTGDDILFSTDDHELVDRVITKVTRSQIRANPQKQGLGMDCAEFLRCSFNRHGGVGYLARSIAAFVCGNWTTENPLGSGDYANAALQNLWTIENRCGHQAVGVLCLKALQRRVPSLSLGHVTFCLSFGNSPIRLYKHTDTICGTVIKSTIKTTSVRDGRESKATQDYLDNHVDHTLLNEAGLSAGSLKKLMLEASYSNTSTREHSVTAQARSCVSSRHLVSIGKWLNKSVGVLANIFPLAQIRNQLPPSTLRLLLITFAGYAKADVYRHAWGEGVRRVNILGFLPYGDARYLAGSVTFSCNLSIKFPLKL